MMATFGRRFTNREDSETSGAPRNSREVVSPNNTPPNENNTENAENAETRMERIRERNRMMLQNFEDENKEDENKEDENLDYNFKIDFNKPLKGQCKNRLSLLGNNFKDLEESDMIYLFYPIKNDYIIECYTREEISKLSYPENRVYEWEGPPAPGGGKAISYLPVYKLPYNGLWIDFMSMIVLKKFKYFYVDVNVDKIAIGSAFGVSNLHGEEESFCDIHPINLKKLTDPQEDSYEKDSYEEDSEYISTEEDAILPKNIGLKYFGLIDNSLIKKNNVHKTLLLPALKDEMVFNISYTRSATRKTLYLANDDVSFKIQFKNNNHTVEFLKYEDVSEQTIISLELPHIYNNTTTIKDLEMILEEGSEYIPSISLKNSLILKLESPEKYYDITITRIERENSFIFNLNSTSHETFDFFYDVHDSNVELKSN
jgi:hypothetical protein